VSTLYNRTFKIGFIATIAVFVVLNFVSYLFALRLYDQLVAQPIGYQFPAPRFPSWGVPFYWEGAPHLFGAAEGLVLNFVAIAACGFLVGLGLRWLTGKYK
jgi:hypothetical protein